MAEEKKIELRTEEVNEILSAVPKWIVRWGISLIFITLVLGLILSYFIKYPDTLSAKATITTLNPPVNLIAKANGKLFALLIKNNQVVSSNEVLAVVDNTANYKDVLKIDSSIDSLSFKLETADSLPDFTFGDSLKLGELTTPYLTFLKSYKDYKLFTEINPQKREIEILNKELVEYKKLLGKYVKQENIYKEELTLIEKDYNRDLGLYDGKVISAREFETKKRDFLTAQRNAENQTITTSNTKITVNNIEKNILQLQIQYFEQVNKYKVDLDQALKNLQSNISTWKQNYLLISSINGKVSFFNYWAVNQNIKIGDAVFSVVPIGQQELIAKLILPTQNSGKVKVGQKVNIKLDNYPYTEYGMLNGIVKNISLVPNNYNYAVDVELTKGLTTSYNKTLTYKEEMSGTAEIITNNLSVLDRVFMKFKKILVK
jgi:multidrug resistance efflux pump